MSPLQMAIKGNRDHSQVDKMLVSKGQFFFLQSDVNYNVVDTAMTYVFYETLQKRILSIAIL